MSSEIIEIYHFSRDFLGRQLISSVPEGPVCYMQYLIYYVLIYDCPKGEKEFLIQVFKFELLKYV